MVRLFREPVVVHDLATDERLEREGSEHVKPEAESSDLDHDMTLRRKVVQDVAFSKRSKREETRERHCETGYERDKGAVMCYSGEAVDGRCPERAIDEERVMVTDKRC